MKAYKVSLIRDGQITVNSHVKASNPRVAVGKGLKNLFRNETEHTATAQFSDGKGGNREGAYTYYTRTDRQLADGEYFTIVCRCLGETK